MAHNLIDFEHPHSGEFRKAPMGFSWTTLFFGPFVMAARKEWGWFFISLLMTLLSAHLSNVVLAFRINKLYIVWLVNQGYRVSRVKSGTVYEASDELNIQLPTLSSYLFAETKMADSTFGNTRL
jgi:hypothetical protein